MRDAAIRNFKSNKAKKFISGQLRYINASEQLGEGIKFLFDGSGNPSNLASLEDIVNERMQTEAKETMKLVRDVTGLSYSLDLFADEVDIFGEFDE